MSIQRIYNRRVPESLPPHRMLTRVSLGLPGAVDLRPYCGPVKDQGSEGCCTGESGSGGLEWVFRRYLKQEPILSPQFFYTSELIHDGDFPQDSGSDGNTLCAVAVTLGCCEEELSPFVAGQIIQPTAEQISNAKKYALGAYHGVAGSQVAASVLGDPVPWVLNLGFTVYESFESDAVASSGVMPIPEAGEQVLGGHEVLVVGYDLADTATLRPVGSAPSFLVKNSWGTDWGIGGFFWMPQAILDATDTDIKIVHAGHPW
jgi:C1A family cysteine protease